MRYLFILLGLASFSFVLLPACAPAPEAEPEAAPEPVFDQAAEETAIRKMMADSFAAHSNHEAEVMAADYEDGLIGFTSTTSREEMIKGAKETYANYKDFHAEQAKEIGIDFLKPDVAIQRRVSKYSSSSGPDGKPVPPLFGLRASVLMKKDGKWLVVAQFERRMTDEAITEIVGAQSDN
jgi:ketosteroid isomerase-like protein